MKNNDFKIIQLLPSFEKNKARFLKRYTCLTDSKFKKVYSSQTLFDEYNLKIHDRDLTLKILLMKLETILNAKHNNS